MVTGIPKRWYQPIAVSPLGSTTHILTFPESTVLIDTGHPSCALQTAALLNQQPLEIITHILHTHGHADHVGATALLSRDSQAGVFMAGLPADPFFREEERILGIIPDAFEPTGVLTDGQSFDFGHDRLHCIETPGHCGGHMCFFLEKQRALFCGDMVAHGDIGTFDIGQAWHVSLEQMQGSVAKMRELEPLTIFPAHGAPIEDATSFWKRLKRRLASFEKEPQVLVAHTLMPLLLLVLDSRGPMTRAELDSFTRSHTSFLSIFMDSVTDTTLGGELGTMLFLLQMRGAIVEENGSFRIQSPSHPQGQ